jgi:hypothetical protein
VDPQQFDSSRLSSYFRELAETSQLIAPSSTVPAELRSVCGPWVSITAAVARASFALAGLGLAVPIVDSGVALSGTDAQTALLMSIKADIQIILKAPLKAAVTWIEQAELTEPGSKYRTQYLDNAVESFVDAESMAKKPEDETVARFGLACVHLTLNNSTLARHWIDKSVISRDEALERLMASFSAPFAAAGRRRTAALKRFLPLANSVEICAATIHGRARVDVVTDVGLEKLPPRGSDLPEKDQPLLMLPEFRYYVAKKSFDVAARK